MDEPAQVCFTVLEDRYGRELQVMSGLQAIMEYEHFQGGELDLKEKNRISAWFMDRYGQK